jgi:C1A family cysteine protease
MRKYNWIKDTHDKRDYRFSKLPRFIRKLIPLPESVDLRPLCSPVVDQLAIGSCTGNALAGHFDFLQLKGIADTNKVMPEEYDPKIFFNSSRLFIYYNERLLEGTTDQDAGATIRDGIKTLAKWGCCRELTWMYDDANTFIKPNPTAYNEAIMHRIENYFRMSSIEEMKKCLADGYPFVFGMEVFESFESGYTAQTGSVNMPEDGERILGGHALMMCGYNDLMKCFLCRNSWGSWGMSGYCWIPYDYISQYASDFWTIRM